MRIIAGKHRGRRIEAPATNDIRPTLGRTREAVFNILSHGQFTHLLQDASIVEIFCGSGAMGLEAMSRGGASVTFVDKSRDALDLARKNAEHMGELPNSRFIRSDSSRLPPSHRAHTLAFVDPPYRQNLASPALTSLLKGGWLADGAVVVVEHSQQEEILIPEGLRFLDERHYGKTKVTFLRLGEAEAESEEDDEETEAEFPDMSEE